MLKMKCSECQEFIVSKLLAEATRIICEHCHKSVPVQDVMVFAKGFTFHRNDLAKRLFRYKSLINEVVQERKLLEKSPAASQESKKSLDQFLEALKEVMAGARNSLRLDFSEPFPVRFTMDQQLHQGSLINLSTSGACLEVDSMASLPVKKTSITLQFSLPGSSSMTTLNGVVVWTNRTEDSKKQVFGIGVEFKQLDEGVMQTLWEFISGVSTNTDL